MKRGSDAGIDDYQVKLDREQIMTPWIACCRSRSRPSRTPASSRHGAAAHCVSV